VQHGGGLKCPAGLFIETKEGVASCGSRYSHHWYLMDDDAGSFAGKASGNAATTTWPEAA